MSTGAFSLDGAEIIPVWYLVQDTGQTGSPSDGLPSCHYGTCTCHQPTDHFVRVDWVEHPGRLHTVPVYLLWYTTSYPRCRAQRAAAYTSTCNLVHTGTGVLLLVFAMPAGATHSSRKKNQAKSVDPPPRTTVHRRPKSQITLFMVYYCSSLDPINQYYHPSSIIHHPHSHIVSSPKPL